MEAALRTAHFLLTGETAGRRSGSSRCAGLEGVKEAGSTIDGLRARRGRRQRPGQRPARCWTRSGPAASDLHFIEVMTCPGGCIAGGGQPLERDRRTRVRARMQALYAIDRDAALRASHQNPAVQRLYEEFLAQPLAHRSHELLHTHYEKRDVIV